MLSLWIKMDFRSDTVSFMYFFGFHNYVKNIFILKKIFKRSYNRISTKP